MSSIITSTDNDFEEILQKNNKVIVKFFAGWCGSCRLIAPKFKQLAEQEKYSNVAFVEIDAENNPESRKLAGVNNLPFFALFLNGTLTDAKPTAKIDVVEHMLDTI